jgi:hypothetical protein
MKKVHNTLAFDTEDNAPELQAKGIDGREKELTQVAAIDFGGTEFHNRKGAPFLKWLERRGEGCVAYAHNLQYDLGNLFRDNLDDLDMRLVGGRIIGAKWRNVQFRDSMNIWPCALKSLGEAFGFRKLEMDIHSKAYVMRDCEIVVKAMKFLFEMCEAYGIRKVPNTLGSLAVQLWKSLGGENPYNDCLFCREGLYGGRVELFRPEANGDLTWTDINSLYPSVMLDKFPDVSAEHNDLCEYGVAGVTIKIPECFVAPLPYRRDDGSIYFPIGTVSGVWTCHEIRSAVDNGAEILKLHDCVGSNVGQAYYSKFVRHFYRERLKTDSPAKKLFYKLVMNNLYGQLGMKGFIQEVQPIQDGKSGILFGNRMLVERRSNLPNHVNYLHAAHVTSYGRLKLLEYLRKLDRRMIYCDTDSTIFTGESPFECGNELGQMKLEAKGEHCECFLPKTYVFDDDYVAKGVPKRCAEEFIKTGRADYFAPFKLREAIRFFDRDNRRPLSIWRKTGKSMNAVYDKKDLRAGIYYPKLHVEANAEQLSLTF